MTTTLILLAIILGLLLVLEVLNALFDSVYEGLVIDAARKEPVPIWLAPPHILRVLLLFVVKIGRTTSLWMHELAHAGMQLVFGGRPRVVLLKNGGFAQARPWAAWRPAQLVYAVGCDLGLGVICMAPIIVGSLLLVALVVAATSITPGEVVAFGRALAVKHDTVVARELAVVGWEAVAGARWFMWPIAIVASLLLVPSMTPSTVDYVIGRGHLLAYSIATLACTAVAVHVPGALWIVAPIAGGVGVAGTWFAPKWARALWSGTALATAVLAFAMAVIAWRTSATPIVALHTGLGVVAYGFGIAAIVFAVFVIGFLALSLLSIRPRTLWYTLRAAPRHLIDIVRTFDTCEACKVHYRGKCDGCGRTADSPAVPATK